jgi:hypothetical protein
MTPLEVTLLSVAIATVIFIILFAVVRRRGGFAKLPPPMLLILRITLGLIFAILGVIGVFLPIMQGWLFFLLSALVLFPKSRFAVKALQKVENRMPRMVARLRRWGIGVPQ